ncbi:MAG: hypothetical protein PHD15_04490 [Clostridia bacterium]|nr:hypothetical protein [Clostridia bacterium]MDD4386998.1 hypothetical protein [Clostridia bacterium]
MNKKRGISLIVLIITIIVIIIIAGAIIISLANNNPITQASKAKYLNDVKSFQTELELYKAEQYLTTQGDYDYTLLQADGISITYDGVVDTSKTIKDLIPTLGNNTNYAGQFAVINGVLVFEGSDTDKQNWARAIGVEVVIVGEPTVTIILLEETVVAQGTDIIYKVRFSSNAPLTYINLSDKIEVTDAAEVALVEQPVITVGPVSGTEQDVIREVDVTLETDNLQNGEYKLRIKSGAVTNINNISNLQDIISQVGFDIDNTAPENPELSADPAILTNGSVTVAITYSEDSVTKEYSFDGTNWNNYTEAVVVTENNTTVYSRGKDAVGNESGVATLTVTNIDKDAPIVVFETNGGSGEEANTKVTVSDSSGLNASTLQYVWDTQNTTTPTTGWSSFSNGSTFIFGNVTGTYYLWIKASDIVGNNVISKTNAFVLTLPLAVNKPLLSAGMTAKKWNGSSWDTVSNPDTDKTWYDYENKEWGNAQTADGSMWVWIPRYEYKIPTSHSGTAQTILVNFLNNTSTTATSGYTVHPAFTFGAVELTGIWVAKFEASGSITAVDIKPEITALKNKTINVMFTACRNMETTYGTRYGWGTSGTGIDTHLMKNTELGAVAYLTHSIYGKNSQIWINPSNIYKTGQIGTGASVTYTGITYSYDDLTYGVQGSTTGNVHGIYDMSGGVWEYTAAYLNNGNSILETNGSSLVNAASQYKDIYVKGTNDTQSENYTVNSSKKGDAVYETSSLYEGDTSWYSDWSNMPYTSNPFFMHGGYCESTTRAGIFAFYEWDGSACTNIGFRPVVAVSNGL